MKTWGNRSSPGEQGPSLSLGNQDGCKTLIICSGPTALGWGVGSLRGKQVPDSHSLTWGRLVVLGVPGLGSRISEVQRPGFHAQEGTFRKEPGQTAPHMSCVTSHGSLNLSEPHLPHLSDGDSSYLTGFVVRTKQLPFV